MNSWTPDNCCGLAAATGGGLRPGGLELTQHLLGFGMFAENSRILDAGCGTGTTAEYLERTLKMAVVGVDRSESMLIEARNLSGWMTLVCAPLEDLPFSSGSFDGIICECVLSQTDADAVLAEFHRVLRPGGTLLLTDLYLKTAVNEQSAGPCVVTREQTEAMIRNAGFVVRHWEDRSRDLRQLAAQLIMSGSGGQDFTEWTGFAGCCSGNAGVESVRSLGYHLLVAGKGAL